MFVYNLLTKLVEKGTLPGWEQPIRSTVDEVIEQSADAILMVLPFEEVDTFSFVAQTGQPMGMTEGDTRTVSNNAIPGSEIMKMGKPMLLDALVTQISVRSAKNSHQDSLHATLFDPRNQILSSINPGDWVVCWMFDNTIDAEKTREKLRRGNFSKLNDFMSGLKFVGKALAPRIQQQVLQNGAFIKQCALQATAFSELDTQIYYDPQMNANMAAGYQFIAEISEVLNTDFNGIPRSVNAILATLLPVFLGKPPRQGTQATPNSSVRVPSEIGKILGFNNAQTYMDILYMRIGVEKYADDYNPPLSSIIDKEEIVVPGVAQPGQAITKVIQAPHPNIFSTGKGLKGAVYAQIAPFNNVPLWSILEQHLIPVANEMYSVLKTDHEGKIVPHLIARQIPFNTEEFVARNREDYTAFRELPRWKITPELITAYDTGKSNAMRVNYVQIQVTGGLGNKDYLAAAQRAATIPRLDEVDIARHGLKSFITQVNGVYEPDALDDGQKWTDMVTDRLIGSHLKLSGSMGTVGIQEPICVGDNLEYDGFVYHIESVEHRLQINPMSGQKSFSTQLAISNGVPATGAALPETSLREFEGMIAETEGSAVEYLGITPPGQPIVTPTSRDVSFTYKGKLAPVKHTINPAANVEED